MKFLYFSIPEHGASYQTATGRNVSKFTYNCNIASTESSHRWEIFINSKRDIIREINNYINSLILSSTWLTIHYNMFIHNIFCGIKKFINLSILVCMLKVYNYVLVCLFYMLGGYFLILRLERLTKYTSPYQSNTAECYDLSIWYPLSISFW